MRLRVEVIVFWVGVIPLAFFYEQLKATFESGVWLFLAVVVYLLALRFVGHFLQRSLKPPNGNP